MSGLKFGATGVPTKAFPLFGRIKGWEEVRKMLSSLKRFSRDEVAQERLKILEFYQEYGEKATLKAFGVNRKTIWVWRKRFNSGRNQLSALISSSTRPKTIRRMEVDLRIIKYIKSLRETHYRLGKRKIKPLVDEYCRQLGIKSISVSTVGKVIKRHHLFFQKQGRIYHHPSSGWAKPRRPVKRLRIRYSPKPAEFGHLQMDTVLKINQGVKLYLYSAIDIKLKFSFSLPYFKLNSFNTLDFFKKLELVYPGQIKSLQTDNGLEFLGVFHQYLLKRKIIHYFIYPRCPKINGVIERYQRTLQEEFLEPNLDLIYHPKLFYEKLAEYLLFYNTKRAHESLGFKSPLDYLIEKGGMS
ncbi:MAG: integrase core domain-containing protein, partial [Microgenomates group bacterium]